MKKIILMLCVVLMLVFSLTSCMPMGTTGEGGEAAETDPSQMIMLFVIYGVIIVGGYFLIIRPNGKKKKAEQSLRDNLEIGDEITTIGGIMGRVISIKEDSDSIVIETSSDRTKLQLKRWSISSVDTVKEQPATAQTKEETTKKGGFFGRKKDK